RYRQVMALYRDVAGRIAPPHGASRFGRGSATALPGSRDVYFGLKPPLDLCKAGAVGNRFSRGGPLQYFHAGPHLLRRGILSLTPDGQHAFEDLQTFHEGVVPSRA